MVDLSIPGSERLEGANEYDPGDIPRFARATRHRDPPAVEDVRAASASIWSNVWGLALPTTPRTGPVSSRR